MPTIYFSRTILIISAIYVVSTPAVADSVFYYREPAIPAVAGRQCDDLASAEGQRFERFLAGQGLTVELVSSRCYNEPVGASRALWNIEIAYRASKQLDEVSTYNPRPTLEPGYGSRSACDRSVSSELALFEQETGLKHFVAYCQAPFLSDQKWIINITGFGEPKLRPYSTSALVSGTPIGIAPGGLQEIVTQQLSKWGAKLAQFTATAGAANRKVSVRYYGPSKISIVETPLAKYGRDQDCLADLDEVADGLEAAGVLNLAAYCHRLDVGGRVELVTLNDVDHEPNLIRASTSYPSFAACGTDKTKILNHYRNDLGRDIKAGFCSYNPFARDFELLMLEKASLTVERL